MLALVIHFLVLSWLQQTSSLQTKKTSHFLGQSILMAVTLADGERWEKFEAFIDNGEKDIYDEGHRTGRFRNVFVWDDCNYLDIMPTRLCPDRASAHAALALWRAKQGPMPSGATR